MTLDSFSHFDDEDEDEDVLILPDNTLIPFMALLQVLPQANSDTVHSQGNLLLCTLNKSLT
jgi:hypothetical protein